ncbi:MAG: hypothetical protein EOM05_00375 [Clostridia bacterium]|nr:hypothetical protein [Clostridia bacterium]
MKKKWKIALYILIAVVIVAVIVAIVYANMHKNQEAQKANWITSGDYSVGKELDAGEYVLISTGEKASYEIIKDKMVIANDAVDNQSYITIEKGQTVKLAQAKMCKIDEAPIFKPDDGVYKQGMYKVGRDLSAGEYVLKADGLGYYAILSDTKGNISSVLESNSFNGKVTISLKAGQYIKILDATMKTK